MRYCDKCGAAIVNRGHKSCSSGIFRGTPIICDECYEKECAMGLAVGKAAFSVGKVIARWFVGILIGLMFVIGACKAEIALAGNLPDATQVKVFIGIEVAVVACFVASKVGTIILRNRFVKFLLRVIAYFTFWMSLIFGVALYFVIKYTV